jgi:RNA-directed DNA polymerase
VAQPRQRKFLGFSFTSEREPRRRIAPKAIARFNWRIANSPALTIAWPNAYLAKLGLPPMVVRS